MMQERREIKTYDHQDAAQFINPRKSKSLKELGIKLSPTTEEVWMRLALLEAQKAQGLTSPNPMVGAVLVKNGKEVSRGYHRRAGLPHAEIEALSKARSKTRGATLYVTLEPCCHRGKRTPPCTEALIASGIRKVIVGSLDPNPQVSGRGVRRLRTAGIEVETGILARECAELNRFYNHWIKTGAPYVLLKMASSLDGRVALANGKSKWITGEKSRREAHRLRSEVDAILVGIRTVLHDDPELTVRHGNNKTRQPHRIVLDPQLKIPESARLLRGRSREKTYVVTAASRLASDKAKRLRKAGVELLSCPTLKSGLFDFKKLMKALGQLSIVSALIEGGPTVWTEMIQQEYFHEVAVFLAPKFLGNDAKASVGPLQLKTLPANFDLQLREVKKLGEDVLLRYF